MVLVDAEHLLTCGHVAADGGAVAPGDVVSVEFALLGAGSDAEVLAEGFRPAADSAGDIALLRLKAPPEGLQPVRLRSLGSLAGVSFAAYGFPAGYDDGLSTHGEVGFAAGLEWVQRGGPVHRGRDRGVRAGDGRERAPLTHPLRP